MVKSDADWMVAALEAAGPRPGPGEEQKKIPYSGRLSNEIARRLAAEMYKRHKKDFKELKTGETATDIGEGHTKRIDIAKRSAGRGTELDVSIKTINFRNTRGRWTQNMERSAREIGDEANAIHEVMPYAVVAALVFLPIECCDDGHPARTGPQNVSSFAAGVFTYRKRTGREAHSDPRGKCERLFIGLYEHEGLSRGEVHFFDVTRPPPRKRRPRTDETMTLAEVIDSIHEAWVKRWQERREYAPD